MAHIKIESIWLDEGGRRDNGMGLILHIDLNNGSYMVFNLDSLVHEPLFSDAVMNRVGKPKTDGERVYWDNGASLSIRDIMNIMQTAKTADAVD